MDYTDNYKEDENQGDPFYVRAYSGLKSELDEK